MTWTPRAKKTEIDKRELGVRIEGKKVKHTGWTWTRIPRKERQGCPALRRARSPCVTYSRGEPTVFFTCSRGEQKDKKNERTCPRQLDWPKAWWRKFAKRVITGHSQKCTEFFFIFTSHGIEHHCHCVKILPLPVSFFFILPRRQQF